MKVVNLKRQAALKYAAGGYAVIPLHSIRNGICTCSDASCDSPGKHPLTPNGHKDGTTDPAQIDAWWQRWPFANIGLVLNNSFCVLDADPRHGAPKTPEEFAQLYDLLPDTPITITGGGGFHCWLKHTLPKPKNADGKLGSGLDFRARGYIVMPPSTHITGNTYQWRNGKSILNKPVAALPGWIAQQLAAPAKYLRFQPKDQLYWYITETIPEGIRNSTMTSLFGLLLQRGIPPHMAREILRCVNEARCNPPLTQDELECIVNSIAERRLIKIKRKNSHVR